MEKDRRREGEILDLALWKVKNATRKIVVDVRFLVWEGEIKQKYTTTTKWETGEC